MILQGRLRSPQASLEPVINLTNCDWLFVGHDCEIARPGSYFTLQAGDNPVVVGRGRDGAIRALHNNCRPRPDCDH